MNEQTGRDPKGRVADLARNVTSASFSGSETHFWFLSFPAHLRLRTSQARQLRGQPRRLGDRTHAPARHLGQLHETRTLRHRRGLFIISFATMHVVVAAAPAVDAEAAGFQIREGPAEIAAAPIGLLGDFGDTRLLPAL